ncbi:biotin synthase BioB [Anaerostipes sp. 494a]|uniref:biotin synthase BioB n=1 Tax=Anaerostipes sp. 494a TaxID=1261636 RepID=UPI0009529302|nr:biotin synthase BioB [Anaerostipes sp. 494a]OLR58754.1 biotin synthase BioB [Anaerostipes sp. 494a]
MNKQIVEEITAGKRLGRKDDLSFLLEGDLEWLCQCADEVRKYFKGNQANLCTIINGKSGRCGEDCKFCAQSHCHDTGVESYGFLQPEVIREDCKKQEEKGVHRYSIVTAGRSLTGNEFEKALEAYRMIAETCGIHLCASHGLLTQEQFYELYNSGVKYYHCNLETSKRFFPYICTTHTWEEKVENIKRAKKAGLKICSGGIFGMGETWQDRIDMAISLQELGVDSIPLNMLIPIKGTMLENRESLCEDEILRIIAIFRLINPEADIRLAAGRLLMEHSGKRAFLSGANAALTGDMLTTSGNNTKQDIDMLLEAGYTI